jgi:protein-S-isoprenylcysteine O-methyltransferase Ste14
MFRWLALVVFAAVLAISGYYRRRARRTGEVIDRRREGTMLLVLRAMVALPLFAAVIAYLVNPRWMAWAHLQVPLWLRWFGVCLGALAIPSAWWLFRNLGRNVSETVLTKMGHELVTTGPYRWVRHPLYMTGSTMFIAVGLMAANWFILALAVLVVFLVRLLVVPREEQALIAKFGDDYRAYMARTGGMMPRLTRDVNSSRSV